MSAAARDNKTSAKKVFSDERLSKRARHQCHACLRVSVCVRSGDCSTVCVDLVPLLLRKSYEGMN